MIKNTLRLLLVISIALIPVNAIRIHLYKKLLRYNIGKRCFISWFTLLDVQELIMEDDCKILGVGNIFLSMHVMHMHRFSRIGGPRIGLNMFRGTRNKKSYPSATFELGNCSIVKLFHYFDLCADIRVGDNVVIGGIRAAFFTHTFFNPQYLPIEIGNNVFIGSNCLFQMDTSIPSNSIVGLGSVVVNRIKGGNAFIAGSPAKVITEDYNYNAIAAFKMRKLVYFDGRNYIDYAKEIK